jgi:hypothetical protein
VRGGGPPVQGGKGQTGETGEGMRARCCKSVGGGDGGDDGGGDGEGDASVHRSRSCRTPPTVAAPSSWVGKRDRFLRREGRLESER